MKLLVPIDGSKASINALRKAIEIAKEYNFSITLLMVVEENHWGYERNQNFWHQVDGSIISVGVEHEVVSKLEERAAELLDAAASTFDFSGIDLEKMVITGEPSIEILDLAKKEGFDLIVMGNRGMSKIKRFFTGSVTQRVIAEAPCPVLSIHEDLK
ncbi:universal stress protein [Acetobacterium malicum]|uniref:universal stress protein n=1 Tax=Acetobacterium malicum TaxID=52692 RepID=UPI000405E12B|nr:universal stress protein [Acetobacterium dehalogenans]